MYTRQITSEKTYTLSEAKRIIKTERERKMQALLYRVKQKFMGILAISMSIATPVFLDGDATISLIMLPLGIYLLFTKEKVVY